MLFLHRLASLTSLYWHLGFLRNANRLFLKQFTKKFNVVLCRYILPAVAKWVCINGRPLSIVEDEGLSELVKILTGDPDFSLCCRQTLTKKVKEMYSEYFHKYFPVYKSIL